MPVIKNKSKSKEEAIKSILDVAAKYLMRGEDVDIQVHEGYLTLFIEKVAMYSCCFNPPQELPKAGQVYRVCNAESEDCQLQPMYRQATGGLYEGIPLFFNHWGESLSDLENIDDHIWDNWELVEQGGE